MKELDTVKLHEILEGEGKDEVTQEKEQKKGIEDSVKIDKKRKGKGEKSKNSYSKDVVERAFNKLHK